MMRHWGVSDTVIARLIIVGGAQDRALVGRLLHLGLGEGTTV